MINYGMHVTRWKFMFLLWCQMTYKPDGAVSKRYGEEEFLEFQEASKVTMKICSLPTLLCVESICIGTCLFLTANVVLILMS